MTAVPREVYCTVTCQSLSPCGRYLCAANTYGQLAIFDLDKTRQRLRIDKDVKRVLQIENDAPISSCATVDRYLVLGAEGHITAREWSASPSGKPSWRIDVPNEESRRRGGVERPDVNALLWRPEDAALYAGCGDNNVYAFDVSQGKTIRTYKGHTDYVHCVHASGTDLISSGEDGIVRLWDTRSPKSVHQFTPYLNDKLARHDIGKWIGSAAISDDWIVCGGGPKLALWQRRSLNVASVFDLPDHGIHVSYFNEDRIIAAGAAPHLYQLNYSGSIAVEIPVSATTVYSTAHQDKPFFCFTIAGSSPYIDLCTNFNYKDWTLHFSAEVKN